MQTNHWQNVNCSSRTTDCKAWQIHVLRYTGQTWKAWRPLGDERQVTERWSTRSKACKAQGPKTNFSLRHEEEYVRVEGKTWRHLQHALYFCIQVDMYTWQYNTMVQLLIVKVCFVNPRVELPLGRLLTGEPALPLLQSLFPCMTVESSHGCGSRVRLPPFYTIMWHLKLMLQMAKILFYSSCA